MDFARDVWVNLFSIFSNVKNYELVSLVLMRFSMKKHTQLILIFCKVSLKTKIVISLPHYKGEYKEYSLNEKNEGIEILNLGKAPPVVEIFIKKTLEGKIMIINF